MKIAIIADSLDNQNAGVYNYTRSVIDALAQKKNRAHQYILIRQKKEAHLPFKQIIVGNIKLPIGYATFRLFFLIPQILKKEKVDAVFEPAHFGPFNLPKRIKRITMIHDLTPILFPEHHRWHSQFLQKLFLPIILKKADLILANSYHTQKDIITYQPQVEHKIKTIHLGRDHFFYPDKNNSILKDLNIDQYFLSVGTVEPRKNLVTLLKAFTLFKNDNPSIQLIIVGGMGWKTELFEKELEQHPYRSEIHLLGFVKKETLRHLYSNALALIYSSLYEGFGFPILEALSCECPAIVSQTSSMPEVGGQVSHYFDPLDIKGLKDKMDLVYNHKHEIKSKELKKQAFKFSWEKYVEFFELEIKSLFDDKY